MTYLRFVSKVLCCVLMLSAISACGGGGGSSQDTTPVILNPGTGTSSVAVAKPSLQFSETTTVSATFKQADGNPVSGISVNFSTTLGTLTPVNGVVITDPNGVATVQLTAGTTSGQGQVTASATVENRQVTKSGLFSVSLPSLNLSPITLGLTTLSYGGSTSVSVTVRDVNGNPYTTQSVDVVFTSTQSALNKASINSPVKTDFNGVATTTYQATTATGADTITASIAGSTVTSTLTVNPLAAGSLSYVSASPANIALKGMGGIGYQETSTVKFRVLDTSGQPKANQQVDFALNTNVGGLALLQSSASTASDGTVSTIVQSGTVSTPVRVTATVRGSNPVISTQSDQLVISTGIPAQDGFSISVSDMNPEALTIDGVAVAVTARLSDHFHNPVPDGTAVYFTTSGGSITPSCTTVKGSCSVNWTSQNPRPTVARGAMQNGRAVILAYAVGEEYFLDLNGNGLADPSDTWIDDSEAFRDDNESGARQVTESFVDFNNDGSFNTGDLNYNGVLQGPAFTGAAKTKHVFSNSVIVMSSSEALISNSCGGSIPIASGSATTCTITVSDVNNNTMPSGTKVEFVLSDVQSCTGAAGGSCSFSIVNPTDAIIIPQNVAAIGRNIGVTISNKTTVGSIGKSNLTVKVTSPGGLITSRTYSIN